MNMLPECPCTVATLVLAVVLLVRLFMVLPRRHKGKGAPPMLLGRKHCSTLVVMGSGASCGRRRGVVRAQLWRTLAL